VPKTGFRNISLPFSASTARFLPLLVEPGDRETNSNQNSCWGDEKLKDLISAGLVCYWTRRLPVGTLCTVQDTPRSSQGGPVDRRWLVDGRHRSRRVSKRVVNLVDLRE
jgi:hypothetical protein